jgi:RNA polymerase sigma-70 factor (ECF subfamily)
MSMAIIDTINQAADGDETAQRALYEAYFAAAYRLAYLLLSNAEDAEETVQDAFIYALSNLHRYDPARSSFWSWLRLILISRCRNQYRRRRWTIVSLDELEDCGRCPSAGARHEPAHWMEELDGQRHVWQMLQRVSTGAREALILRYYQDLPYAEIATLLGCSVEAARSRVAHGKMQLRRLLTSTTNDAAVGWSGPEPAEG